MTTVSEFNKIIQIMYDKGYVLVSPHDMATVNDDGTMSRGKIMVPEGKIPFVLSQDDVSYYHYMDGDGCASKLVLDENGEVKNEYVEADGSVSVGDYDLVPLLDTFIKEHPDFSYHTEPILLTRPVRTYRMIRRNSWRTIRILTMIRMWQMRRKLLMP